MLPAALIESVPTAAPSPPLQPLQLPPPAPPIPDRSTLPVITELLPVMLTMPEEEKMLPILICPTSDSSVNVLAGDGTTLLVGEAVVPLMLMLGAVAVPPVAWILSVPAATDQPPYGELANGFEAASPRPPLPVAVVDHEEMLLVRETVLPVRDTDPSNPAAPPPPSPPTCPTLPPPAAP